MKRTILIPAFGLFVAGFMTAVGLELVFRGPGVGAIVCFLGAGAGLFESIARLKQIEAPAAGKSDAKA